MGEYRSLFGLASVRDQAGSYLYDIAFWCNEKGVSARQQLMLKHIEGEWHLAQQEETVVQPRSDEKRILSHIAVLEGRPPCRKTGHCLNLTKTFSTKPAQPRRQRLFSH